MPRQRDNPRTFDRQRRTPPPSLRRPDRLDPYWNRTDEYIPAREAFSLYERNWRFVDPEKLEAREQALIQRLAQRYGAGVHHA